MGTYTRYSGKRVCQRSVAHLGVPARWPRIPRPTPRALAWGNGRIHFMSTFCRCAHASCPLTLTYMLKPAPAVQYRLERKVGEGTYGVVYRATEMNSGQVVAVKVWHWFRGARCSRSDCRMRCQARAQVGGE